MAVTEVWGKGVLQVVFDASGGNWVISRYCRICAVRLTGNVGENDYLTIYEAEGNNPVIAKLTQMVNAITIWSDNVRKIGVDWTNSNISYPTDIVLSIDIKEFI